MTAKELFTEQVNAQVETVIAQAENLTSGEIRLFVEDRCKVENVLDRAAFLFAKLEMHKTELRNGVLFYMAVKDHQFAILGDGGINAKVQDDFWDHIKDEMGLMFKAGNIPAGICKGIAMAGVALSMHFPVQDDDVDELPNQVIIG